MALGGSRGPLVVGLHCGDANCASAFGVDSTMGVLVACAALAEGESDLQAHATHSLAPSSVKNFRRHQVQVQVRQPGLMSLRYSLSRSRSMGSMEDLANIDALGSLVLLGFQVGSSSPLARRRLREKTCVKGAGSADAITSLVKVLVVAQAQVAQARHRGKQFAHQVDHDQVKEKAAVLVELVAFEKWSLQVQLLQRLCHRHGQWLV